MRLDKSHTHYSSIIILSTLFFLSDVLVIFLSSTQTLLWFFSLFLFFFFISVVGYLWTWVCCPEVGVRSVPQPLYTLFIEANLGITLSLLIRLILTCQLALGIPSLGLQSHLPCPSLHFHGRWESKPGSLCLHSKPFNHWAISPNSSSVSILCIESMVGHFV